MNHSHYFAGLALAAVIGAKAQSKIEIGALDPPALDGLKGEIGCVAYHLPSICEYVLGYVVDGSRTVVVLKEFERRLESGKAQYVILDLEDVPNDLAGILRVTGCRYDGDEKRPIVAVLSATGDRGDWVGPADWVVVVDFASKELAMGDSQSVECWVGP